MLVNAPPRVAVDPITLMIHECMAILLAMRKMNRWSHTGVAALLGAGDLFGDDEEPLGVLRGNGAAVAPTSNPLHQSFLQLRQILADTTDINSVDSLTLLQPFLMAVEASGTLGHVTALALDALAKFFDYGVLLANLLNLPATLVQVALSLTHCRFEALAQDADDAVLLKVLRLLEQVVLLPLLATLPNSAMSEVLQTCLLLACNKRRSEVLRRAAEMATAAMTVHVFLRLRDLEPDGGDEVPQVELPKDVMGAQESTDASDAGEAVPGQNEGDRASDTVNIGTEKDTPVEEATENKTGTAKSEEEAAEKGPDASEGSDISEQADSNPGPGSTQEKDAPAPSSLDVMPFDITCINEVFAILISMVAPENQYQHMESTRVFALALINSIIEVAGDDLPRHLSLMALVADPVSKDVLYIMTTTDSPALLLGALRLFTTMTIVLNSRLKSQIELSFNLLFRSMISSDPDNQPAKIGLFSPFRLAQAKELIVESLLLLWTRLPQFFAQLFVEFDCDFERSDMATAFVHFLCKLALPESALVLTDNVPPICLEGVLSLISGINDRAKSVTTNDSPEHPLIRDKEKKNSFVQCTAVFNESPKKGIAAFKEKGFISDPSDPCELAELFFHKSTRLNKKVLGEYLAKPENVAMLKHFMTLFEFNGLRVDEALRLILKAFRLPGESQQIERIVELFAEAYVACQTDASSYCAHEPDQEPVTPDRDAVFVLSYSIILLNTDLHNPQVKKQMDLDSYRRNLKGVNNGKDFPEWYLAKIYASIRDREIIMPEEHHGTDKWFDDAWNNLILSQSKYAQDHGISIEDFDLATLCQFDKLLFVAIVDETIDTLFQVFAEASDDSIVTKLMLSIDKCANICITYGMTAAVDKLIERLADLTTLSARNYLTIADDSVRANIPITQITVEKKKEAITVSNMAVHFGRDFKAQLSTVVLFRLIKKPACRVTLAWLHVVKIILTLFENCLINPNLFSEFQKKLRLTPLAKVKPRYTIQRTKPLKDAGLLLTFSSFLKSYSDEPPEPTDQEVESTFSTIDCVRSVNVPGIFDTVSKGSNTELTTFIDLVLDNLPEYAPNKSRFFETEIMFLFEIAVCFSLIVNDTIVTGHVIEKLLHYLTSEHLSTKGYVRLCVYLYLLGRQSDGSQKCAIVETLKHLATFNKDVFAKYGSALNHTLFSLVDDESGLKSLITEESYWTLLKLVGSSTECAPDVLTFVESFVRNSPEDINGQNYVAFLALLDEISSLGAVGAHLEQSKDHKVEGLDPEVVKSLVEVSNKSVTLTGELAHSQLTLSYPLIQALAHQCFNPCREIRTHAILVLQVTLLSGKFSPEYTAGGIYEYGLFPLLTELEKDEVFHTDTAGFPDTHQQILNLVSKVFLQFHGDLEEEERSKVWLGILDNFVVINQLNAKFHKTEVRESSLEIMKNMLLVLRNDFLVPENTELWTATWNSLDPIYPGMKEELPLS